MGELSELPNIGKEVEKQLNQVGIHTKEELINIGSKKAWKEIQKIDKSACIHRLMAIEGAIRGIRKSELSQEVKNELKEFYNLNKNKIKEEK